MRAQKRLLALATAGLDHVHWYEKANAKIAAVCTAMGWDIERFVSVLAITSPRVHVSRNWTLAVHYMTHGEAHTQCMRSVVSALTHWEKTGEIRGPKTRAFAANLLGDLSVVVLDTWVAKALRVDQAKLLGAFYLKQVAKIKAVAKALDLQPAQAQAAIWAGIMREHNNSVREF